MAPRFVGKEMLLVMCCALFLGPLAGAGCATVAGATEVAAEVLLPPREEVRLGRQMAREVAEELSFHRDDLVQNYVEALGNRIAAKADTPSPIRYTFRVVDDADQINAFAMPGGYIYVYSGLIKAADNEAELAAVMAHEIAHVTERHVAERLVAAYGLQAITAAALGEDPGLIEQLVAAVAGQGFLLKYSRDHEREADAVGFEYMVAAGYDPMGFVTFFEKLEGGPRMPDLLSSHPAPDDRIEAARRRIERLRRRPTETNPEGLARVKRRL